MYNNVEELYSNDLALAIKARQDFLDSLTGERKKQALAFQKEISAKLKSASSVHNRLVIMQQMLFDKVRELELKLNELQSRLVEEGNHEESLKEAIPFDIKERKGER